MLKVVKPEYSDPAKRRKAYAQHGLIRYSCTTAIPYANMTAAHAVITEWTLQAGLGVRQSALHDNIAHMCLSSMQIEQLNNAAIHPYFTALAKIYRIRVIPCSYCSHAQQRGT